MRQELEVEDNLAIEIDPPDDAVSPAEDDDAMEMGLIGIGSTQELIQRPPSRPASLHQSVQSSARVALRFLHSVWSIFKNWVIQLKALIFLAVYTFFGAGLFMYFEVSTDLEAREEAYHSRLIARDGILLNLRLVYEDGGEDREEKWKEAILQFEKDLELNEPELESAWTFWMAFLYAGTLYTTIGYGNIACKTLGGRVATIFYAIVGIPIMIVILNSLGDFFLKWLRTVANGGADICLFVGVRLGIRKIEQDSEARQRFIDITKRMVKMGIVSSNSLSTVATTSVHGEDEDEDEELHPDPPVLSAIFVAITWVVFSGSIFLLWEDWTLFESIYFSFISLSTIGLGDMTPSHPEYMIMMFGIVIIGLSLVSVCVEVIKEKIELMYMALLNKMIEDYVKALESGDPNAQMGMMAGFQDKAKFLMPLVSKKGGANVMNKVKEQAQKKGIELPPVLTNINPETGMPAFASATKASFNELIEKANEVARKESSTPVPHIRKPTKTCAVGPDNEIIGLREKWTQSVVPLEFVHANSFAAQARPDYSDFEAQTSDTESVDSGIQCWPSMEDIATQAELASVKSGVETEPVPTTEAFTQMDYSVKSSGASVESICVDAATQSAPRLTTTAIQPEVSSIYFGEDSDWDASDEEEESETEEETSSSSEEAEEEEVVIRVIEGEEISGQPGTSKSEEVLQEKGADDTEQKNVETSEQSEKPEEKDKDGSSSEDTDTASIREDTRRDSVTDEAKRVKNEKQKEERQKKLAAQKAKEEARAQRKAEKEKRKQERRERREERRRKRESVRFMKNSGDQTSWEVEAIETQTDAPTPSFSGVQCQESGVDSTKSGLQVACQSELREFHARRTQTNITSCPRAGHREESEAQEMAQKFEQEKILESGEHVLEVTLDVSLVKEPVDEEGEALHGDFVVVSKQIGAHSRTESAVFTLRQRVFSEDEEAGEAVEFFMVDSHTQTAHCDFTNAEAQASVSHSEVTSQTLISGFKQVRKPAKERRKREEQPKPVKKKPQKIEEALERLIAGTSQEEPKEEEEEVESEAQTESEREEENIHFMSECGVQTISSSFYAPPEEVLEDPEEGPSSAALLFLVDFAAQTEVQASSIRGTQTEEKEMDDVASQCDPRIHVNSDAQTGSEYQLEDRGVNACRPCVNVQVQSEVSSFTLDERVMKMCCRASLSIYGDHVEINDKTELPHPLQDRALTEVDDEIRFMVNNSTQAEIQYSNTRIQADGVETDSVGTQCAPPQTTSHTQYQGACLSDDGTQTEIYQKTKATQGKDFSSYFSASCVDQEVQVSKVLKQIVVSTAAKTDTSTGMQTDYHTTSVAVSTEDDPELVGPWIYETETSKLWSDFDKAPVEDEGTQVDEPLEAREIIEVPVEEKPHVDLISQEVQTSSVIMESVATITEPYEPGEQPIIRPILLTAEKGVVTEGFEEEEEAPEVLDAAVQTTQITANAPEIVEDGTQTTLHRMEDKEINTERIEFKGEVKKTEHFDMGIQTEAPTRLEKKLAEMEMEETRKEVIAAREERREVPKEHKDVQTDVFDNWLQTYLEDMDKQRQRRMLDIGIQTGVLARVQHMYKGGGTVETAEPPPSPSSAYLDVHRVSMRKVSSVEQLGERFGSRLVTRSPIDSPSSSPSSSLRSIATTSDAPPQSSKMTEPPESEALKRTKKGVTKTSSLKRLKPPAMEKPWERQQTVFDLRSRIESARAVFEQSSSGPSGQEASSRSASEEPPKKDKQKSQQEEEQEVSSSSEHSVH